MIRASSFLVRSAVIFLVFIIGYGPAALPLAQALLKPQPANEIAPPAAPPGAAEDSPPAGSPNLDPPPQIESPETPGEDQPVKNEPEEPPPELNVIKKQDEPDKGEHSGDSASPASSPPPPPFSSVQPVPGSYTVRPEVDQSTGALTYRYPLAAPPGRGGMTPDLALVYNSQDRREGSLFGYGWSLSLPFIDRQNLSGIGNFFTDEYFTSSLAGELTRVAAGSVTGNFAARIDDGSFVKYTFSSNTWTAKTKDGVTFYFGTASNSQVFDPSVTSNVARWMIDRIEDKNGNRINFSYFRDSNQLYLDTLTYTDTATGNGIFSIVFTRELRPTTESYVSYASGFRIDTKYRIKEIQIYVNQTLSSKYVLNYSQSPANSRSLLSSIAQTGYDSVGVVTILPPTSFDYSAGVISFAPVDTNLFSGIELRRGYLVTDVNNDAYADLVRSYWQQGSPPTIDKEVRLNNHAGGFETATNTWIGVGDYLCRFDSSQSLLCQNNGTTIFDLNGDLLPDYVTSNAGGAQTTLNTGSSWSGSGPTVSSLEATYTYRPQVGEFDGGDVAEVQEVSVGGNFGTPLKQGNRLADVNHDGIADTVRSIGDPLNSIGLDEGIHLGTGYYANGASQFSYESDWLFVNGTNIGASAPAANAVFEHTKHKDAFMADFNGDDLADAFFVTLYSSGPPPVYTGNVWRYSGKNWTAATSIGLTPGYVYQESQAADVSGDGLLDLIITECTNESLGYGTCQSNLYTNTSSPADLLQNITLPAGGVVSASYKASAVYKDAAGNLLNPQLPMAIQTVERLGETDAVTGVSATTTYSYAGGRYFFNGLTDRRFAGFGQVTAIKPDSSKSDNYFHVSIDGKIGWLYRTDVFDAAGNLIKRNLTEWSAYELPALGQSRHLSAPKTSVELSFNSAGSHRDKAGTAVYATTTGALLLNTEYGEVSADTSTSTPIFTDTGPDLRSNAYTYAADGAAIELLASQTFTDSGSSTRAQTRFYYDNLPLGQVSIGNKTKEERLIDQSTGTYAATQWSYLSNGLVQTETDPLNHATQFIYDSFSLYPSTITNALNQSTAYTYDYSSGQPLSVTDPNGELRTSIYDGLDRVIQERQPKPIDGTAVKTHAFTYTDTALNTSILEQRYFSGDEPPLIANQYSIDLERDNSRYLSAPDSPSLSVTGQLTIESWIKLESEPSGAIVYPIAAKWSATANQRSYAFGYDRNGVNSAGRLSLSVSNNGASDNTATITLNPPYIPAGEWHHVAVTYNDGSGQTRFYLDGAQISTPVNIPPGSIYDSGAQLEIGAQDGGANTFFLDGLIDEARIWSVVRTQNEINDNKSAELSAQANLRGVWHLNNNFSDASGNANTLTNQNGAVFSIDAPFGVWPPIPNAPHTRIYFDGFGLAVQQREFAEGFDAAGVPAYNVTDIHYDSLGRLGTSSVPYVSYGSVRTGIPNQQSLLNIYNYDALDRLALIKQSTGNTTTAYDRWDETVTDPKGNQKTFSRDAFDRLVRVDEYLTATSSPYITNYQYNAAGNLTKITDAAANIRNFTYDARGLRLTAEDLHGSADSTFGTSTAQYDAAGNLTQKRTPKGNVVNYTYDVLNRKLTENFTGAPGVELVFTYDTCARGVGRLCSETRGLDSRSLAYDYAGNVVSETSVISGNSYATGYDYDYLGGLKKISQPDSSLIDYTLNTAGKIETVSFRESLTAATTSVASNIDYAPTGAPNKIILSNGLKETYLYDPNAQHRLTERLVDPVSGLSASIDFEKDLSQFLSAPSSASLDILGDLTLEAWVKLESQPVNGGYSRILSKWGAIAAQQAYILSYFNNAGTGQIEFRMGNGSANIAQTLNYTLLSETWYHLASVYKASLGTVEIFINGASIGTMSGFYNSILSTTANFELGAIQSAGDFDGLMDDVRIWSEARTAVQISGNKNSEIDSAPNLKASWHLNNNFSDFSGNANTLANPLNAAFSTDVPFTSGSQTFRRFRYSYDSVGNLLSVIENSNTSTTTSNYSYDGLDRLIEVNVSTSTAITTSTYSYNSIGNLLSMSENYATTTYQYNGNQGTNYANPHAATVIANVNLTYDKNGNLTERSDQITHTWDYNNRLTTLTVPAEAGGGGGGFGPEGPDPTISINYRYDSNGERTYINVQAGATTYYPTKFYNISNNNKKEHLFLYGSPIATIERTGTSTPVLFNNHGDHLQSTALVTDSSSQIVEQAQYKPFGSIKSQSGTHTEQRKFTSHQYDDHATTKYTYAQARYLNTDWGRFLSEEPLFWDAPEGLLEDPQLMNSYAYARNNPVKYVDPTGKLIEYFGRTVMGPIGWFGGIHTAGYFKPENPDAVNLTALGIPQGTQEFTIGFYPKDGKLVLEAAYEGKEGVSDGAARDFAVAIGKKSDSGRIAVSIPSGYESEAALINSFGEIAAGYNNSEEYSVLNQNSNTGFNTVGQAAGLGNQINQFRPRGAAAINNLLPVSAFTTKQSQIAVIQAHISALQQQVAQLQMLLNTPVSANSTTPWRP